MELIYALILFLAWFGYDSYRIHKKLRQELNDINEMMDKQDLQIKYLQDKDESSYLDRK